MTCEASSDLGATSARERALKALTSVLKETPGIRLVSRSDVTAEQVSEHQLPAILIVERSTTYRPQAAGPRRTVRVDASILLDVQGVARRGCSFAEVSATRESLVHAVLMQLYAQPALRPVQSDHAMPVVIQPTLNAQVTYVQVPPPFTRAMIQLDIVVEEQVDPLSRTSERAVLSDIHVGR